MEFELAYYDSAVHRFNHYTTRTPQDPSGRLRLRRQLYFFIIGLEVSVFANGPGDRVSIPGQIPKTQNFILDTYLLNIRHYKVRIKGKVKHSTEKSIHIYPTPPLGQDITQGQFFKRSLTRFEFRVFLLLD